MEALRLRVSGRVQGVGFRWFTESLARERDVSGYVKNLRDGRVEVVAQAETSVLESFVASVHCGPPASRVDTLEREAWAVDPKLTSFDVRF